MKIAGSVSSQIKLTSFTSEIVNHDYSEISDYRIIWNNIFNIDSNDYFVYFYSRNCSHCEKLKNWVIEKRLNGTEIYFIEDSKDIILVKDVKFTIGASSAEKIGILGFPSMLKITNHLIEINVAGEEQIKTELNH